MRNRKFFTGWIITGCILVIMMVVIGGITRLTGSGLSITRWDVITGTIPPLNHEQWLTEFEHYKQTPQYRHINLHFDLKDFKYIYWWEYIHRLLGRLIGIVFLIPFLYFLFTKQVNRRVFWQLLSVFVLGTLQGFIGWYMVKSGLVENTSVSHFRLALHLFTALATLGFLFWILLENIAPGRAGTPETSKSFLLLFSLLLVQILFGAFTAGLKAGFIYNTFPWMGDSMIPPGLFSTSPLFNDLFNNLTTVQFIHRWLGTLILFFGLSWWIKSRSKALLKIPADFFSSALFLQFILGVITILYLPLKPVLLGTIHQLGAVVVFLSGIYILYLFYGKRST